jgi:hypothetical protein
VGPGAAVVAGACDAGWDGSCAELELGQRKNTDSKTGIKVFILQFVF